MISLYQVTDQGKQTRDRILEILESGDGLSREEICDRGVTYAQVRRQTKTLVNEGKLRSTTGLNGKRYYFLNCTIAFFLACLVPIVQPYQVDMDDERPDRASISDRINNSDFMDGSPA